MKPVRMSQAPSRSIPRLFVSFMVGSLLGRPSNGLRLSCGPGRPQSRRTHSLTRRPPRPDSFKRMLGCILPRKSLPYGVSDTTPARLGWGKLLGLWKLQDLTGSEARIQQTRGQSVEPPLGDV